MKTLICVRDIPYSTDTVSLGELVAGLRDDELTLMTVVDREALVPEAEIVLERAREVLSNGAVNSKVRVGSPFTEILAESQEEHYDVVVVGSTDAITLTDVLFSTIARRVAGRAGISVLIVRNNPKQLEQLLVCTAGLETNEHLVEVSASLAKSSGAQLTLLHVTNPVPSMYTGLHTVEETLDEMLHTDTPLARHLRWSAHYLAEQNVDADIKLRHGTDVDEIVREAQLGGYDMILIGTARSTGIIKRFLVDDVTLQVVDRAPCSVLVVQK